MTVKKLDTGQWVADFYPLGRSAGKRTRKKFATKGEALAFERFALDPTQNKPWLEEQADKRRLADLIESWYNAHGVTLDDGQKRKGAMTHADECMGRPSAIEFNAQLFSRYREKRLKGGFARSTRISIVSPRTLNLELAYFRAMFNELERLGEWKNDNPLKSVRPFQTEESEMAFLTAEQIDRLLAECENSRSESLLLVVKICLSTGARWSEAETIKSSQLTKHKIIFIKTKGRRNRTVPISEELYEQLPKTNGPLFASCYAAFRKAIARANIELPAGQSSHVLRHTFASHFMMNGGNILVLQRILGHTDIKMTMRYSHFSPDHLDEAVRLNPLAKSVAKVSHEETYIQ
ncbi:tyrosine-type recombinase/integrase [Sodalis sp. RH15]|uniref:phage integrase n=1 Tax=Sodalis sp. RH15 TaxID=3394330 RepID=UPI0039B4CC1B